MNYYKARSFWLPIIYNTVLGVIIFFSAIFIYTYFSFIYKIIITEDKVAYTKFSYALFAANAVAASCLFAFGRSPVFILRFFGKGEKIIYQSGTMFLFATLIGFFLSGWSYMITYVSFENISNLIPKSFDEKYNKIYFSVCFGIILLFSIAGLFNFLKWATLANKLLSTEKEAENKKF